jgi:hypothetical protein
VRNALKVLIIDTACGTGTGREVESTASSYHLVAMLPKNTRAKPCEAIAYRLADELDSIACQKDVDSVPRLDRCCRNEKGECRFCGILRPAGDRVLAPGRYLRRRYSGS